MPIRELHLFIEGDARLRAGFSQLFMKALREPCQKQQVILKVMLCGSNGDAFNLCRRAAGVGVDCVLLIDADSPVAEGRQAREHLHQLHGWKDLPSLKHGQVHLMVVAMESWLVCDAEAWTKVFGSKFRSDALPKARNIESVDNKSLTDAINRATRDTPSGPYHKVKHGVRLLETLCPDRVADRAPHCRLLFEELRRRIAG